MKQGLKNKLEPLLQAGKLRPGALAAYIQLIERQKRDINYDEDNEDELELYLEGRKASYTLEGQVPADVLTDAK